MKFKIFVVLLACSLLWTAAVFADETPAIYVNGTQIQTDAYIENGVTYVPLRAVSQGLGANVAWNQEENRVDIGLLSEEQAIQNAISRISPSVVAIVGNYMGETTATYQEKYAEGIAHGTGIIITSGGEILTNAHVVKDLTSVIVILRDGSGYEGRIKYIDEMLDLAVIKIDKLGLPVATFTDEGSMTTGTKVLAIGTPVTLGLRNSVSLGIISGVNRSVSGNYALIQTDAAVNPGNSGGPLVNLQGEVVGVNSSGYMAAGIEGMNFAIPVTSIKYALSQFSTYGKINRPGLGAELEEPWTARLGLPSGAGLTVKSVTPGGNAESAGISPGDTITAVDGTAVNNNTDWHEKMKDYLPGSTASLDIIHNGSPMTIPVTFGEYN